MTDSDRLLLNLAWNMTWCVLNGLVRFRTCRIFEIEKIA